MKKKSYKTKIYYNQKIIQMNNDEFIFYIFICKLIYKIKFIKI